MHKIVLAGLGKRALAAIIDVVLAVFIGMGIFVLAQLGFDNSIKGKDIRAQLTDCYNASGLFYADGDGAVKQYEGYDNYLQYQNIVLKYYTEYMVEGCPEDSRHPEYTTYWYNVMILGQDDVKNLYSEAELSAREEPSRTTGKAYFEYQGTDYDSLAMPIKGFYVDQDVSKGLTEDGKARLLSFYYNPSQPSVYYNAGNHFVQQSFVVSLIDQNNAFTKTYPLLIAIGVVYPIWYMVLPMILKDGQTLGKKFMGLCVCNSYGFKVKRPQMVIRSIPALLLMLIIFFFFGNVYGVMALSGLMLLSYLLAIFTPDRRAIHDYMSMTMVLDAKESLVFKDIDEQEAAETSFKETMKRAEETRAAVDLTEGDPTIEKIVKNEKNKE